MRQWVVLLLVWSLIVGAEPAGPPPAGTAIKPGCPDAQVFGAGLISQVCWNCLFPLRIGGIELAASHPAACREYFPPQNPAAPTAAEQSNWALCDQVTHQARRAPRGAAAGPFCVCPDPLGVPEPGMTMGFWTPARLIEVVRLPYCSPSLGGIFLRRYPRLQGGWQDTTEDTTAGTFYSYHYFAFPLLALLDLFVEPACYGDGYVDFDLLYLSELDPTWNSDELALIMNPEAALFANPVALAACLVDGGAATVGQPLDELFWCAGTWGNLYPLTGTINWEGSPPRDTSLIATRAVAALHRRGLAWKTMGNSALCRAHLHPFILKSQYKLQQYYPLAEANGNHWLGQSTFTWGEWRHLPAVGEDFVHVLWRWTDCCLRF